MILGLLKPEMKILEDREPYYYFQSTNTTIAHHPMVTDIFEVVMFMLFYRYGYKDKLILDHLAATNLEASGGNRVGGGVVIAQF